MYKIKISAHRYREGDSSWCHFGVHPIKKGRVVIQVTFPKYYYFDLCEKHATKAGIIPNREKKET